MSVQLIAGTPMKFDLDQLYDLTHWLSDRAPAWLYAGGVTLACAAVSFGAYGFLVMMGVGRG